MLSTGVGAAATCQNPANGCVLVNWFGPTGSITPEAVDFLTDSSTVTTRVSLAQARGTINGDFGWTIPWANEPVAFAVGGEFREYTAAQISDALAKAGDLAGAGGAAPDIDGGYNVYEGVGGGITVEYGLPGPGVRAASTCADLKPVLTSTRGPRRGRRRG